MGSDNFDDQDVAFADAKTGGDVDVSMAEFMSSGLFQRTYREGMQLVEETSAYLDGPGREASRNLSREASLAYAGESMRLTTRLMQVAAWLLVRKAVAEGEISPEEARSEKYRLASKEIARSARLAGAAALPPRLLEIISQSEQLYARVERLDSELRRQGSPFDAGHPLADQLSRVEAFFQESALRH
jgi:regulator of CtrA degradation